MTALEDARCVLKTLAAALGMFAIGIGVGARIVASRVSVEFCDPSSVGVGATCLARVEGATAGVGEQAIWVGFASVLLAGVLAASETYDFAALTEAFINDN